MICCDCEEMPLISKGVFKMKPEKYEAPEVEFVEMEEDIVTTSSDCPTWKYGDGCTGELAV